MDLHWSNYEGWSFRLWYWVCNHLNSSLLLAVLRKWITLRSLPFPLQSSRPLPLPSPRARSNCKQVNLMAIIAAGARCAWSLIHFANVASLPELFATGLICPRAFISANHDSSLAIVANANLPELEKQCQFCSTNDCHLKMKPISLMYQVH